MMDNLFVFHHFCVRMHVRGCVCVCLATLKMFVNIFQLCIHSSFFVLMRFIHLFFFLHCSQLQQSIVDNETSIVSSRLERQQRDMNQQIRRQQDEDYLESLRADQEKERKRREEREQKEKTEQELRQRKLREQNEEERLRDLRVQMGKQMQPEPKTDTDGVIKIRVKLPNGRKVTRLFFCQDSIKHLFQFVFSQPDCPKNFKLKTNFPVRELPCSHPTLQHPECCSTDCLKQEPNKDPISFEQFGITNDETLYLYDLDA